MASQSTFPSVSQAQAMVAALDAPLTGHATGWFSETTRERFLLASIRALVNQGLMSERLHQRGRMVAALTDEGRRRARALASVVATIAAARRAA